MHFRRYLIATALGTIGGCFGLASTPAFASTATATPGQGNPLAPVTVGPTLIGPTQYTGIQPLTTTHHADFACGYGMPVGIEFAVKTGDQVSFVMEEHTTSNQITDVTFGPYGVTPGDSYFEVFTPPSNQEISIVTIGFSGTGSITSSGCL